jgi:ssDNA-binding Zn-finger/Zn-ribbon topoisomerase 1
MNKIPWLVFVEIREALDRIAAALEAKQTTVIDLGIEPCPKCGEPPSLFNVHSEYQWGCTINHEENYWGPPDDPTGTGWNAMARELNKGEQAK